MNQEITYIYQALHNPKNKLITHDDLKLIFEKAGILEDFMEKNVNVYEFDLQTFQKAFTHLSYSEKRKRKILKNVIEIEDEDVNVNLCVPIQKDSSERLEWLGDAIIQSVVGVYLWNRFPDMDEGFYTKNRSKLVKTEALGTFGKYLGFSDHLLLSKYQDDNGNGRNNPKFLEDCFEAMVGSLYEETKDKFNYDFVSKFIINCIETKIDIPLLLIYDNNYKHILMEVFHSRFDANPTYGEIGMEEVEIGNNIKKKYYTMCVKDIYGNEIAHGKATTKKEAEQLAAKDACKSFGLKVSEKPDFYLKTKYD